MSSDENYIHPQTLQKMVFQKREQVAKLQGQCQEHAIKIANATTTEALNLQYLALKAENEVLKARNPNVIPRCKTLLFAWTHQKLQEDVKNLEELLSFQEKMKKMSYEKELELRKICQRESLQLSIPDLELEEAKENESLRSDILLCLHQKLIRRLRRIAREYFPAVTGNKHQIAEDFLKQDKTKSLFSILQALFPDLKDKTLKPSEWERVEGIYIKNSYPKEYVELLLSSKIVGLDNEETNFMKI